MNRENIKKIGVIGTGMIGTSIAVLTTGHGFYTVMFAMDKALRDASRKAYDNFYSDIEAHKLLTDKQISICSSHLSYSFDYDAFKDCDIIFECVVEKADVKHQVYQEIVKHCPKVRAICSVSSAIVVEDLVAKMTTYKDRVIVAHPFYPPHLVPYFELASGTDTDPSVITFVKTVLEDLDRKPVVLKKSAPGFIGNRLQFALWREALNIVDSGIANPEDVDTCLRYSFCPRYTAIGMYEHFDNAGLQLNYNVSKTIFPTLSNIKEVPASISDKIERGDLGRPTGKGFYDWSKIDKKDFDERVGSPYWRLFNWDISNIQ